MTNIIMVTARNIEQKATQKLERIKLESLIESLIEVTNDKQIKIPVRTNWDKCIPLILIINPLFII